MLRVAPIVLREERRATSIVHPIERSESGGDRLAALRLHQLQAAQGHALRHNDDNFNLRWCNAAVLFASL